MEPRFERGEALILNSALPIIPDKDVMLASAPDADGKRRALVRRLR